jgi:PAS domain-containing protein
MGATYQRPVELILARGLVSNLATPAYLVDVEGKLVFFNDPAGDLLGLRYDEAGQAGWGARFVPLKEDGEPIPEDDLPLAVALREVRPVHICFHVRQPHGNLKEVEVSAFPIVGNAGLRGALAIFWTAATT